MMDTFDDARAGFATVIVRRGRPVAAIVPVEVAEDYAADGGVRASMQARFAAAVDTATREVMAALAGLRPEGSPPGDPPDDLVLAAPTQLTGPEQAARLYTPDQQVPGHVVVDPALEAGRP